MKHLIVIIGLTLFLPACKSTKSTVIETEPPKQEVKTDFVGGVPKITFDNAHHNFGDVPQGQLREKIYSFTNTGDGPLDIELVTSCTCTELEWPRKTIYPGERGALLVVFNSAGKEGITKVDVDIIANTEPIVVTATFVANVVIPE